MERLYCIFLAWVLCCFGIAVSLVGGFLAFCIHPILAVPFLVSLLFCFYALGKFRNIGGGR